MIENDGQPEFDRGIRPERLGYDSDGQTVQDRLNQLAQKNAELKELNEKFEALQPNLSDQDWISYKDRWRIFGEEAAIRWVVNKYGPK